MTLAVIAGVGMTKFGKQAERTIEDIGREALVRANQFSFGSRSVLDETRAMRAEPKKWPTRA